MHEEVGPRHFRNVAIFADGEVDRSPTGSATSARTALLLDDGVVTTGAHVAQRLAHRDDVPRPGHRRGR